jgi:KDO2-lipid IV(A) lauroyltransferase
MQGRRITDWLVYLAVRVFVCIAQTMRISTCRRIAAALAWFVTQLLHVREEVIDDNLRQVFPSMKSSQRNRLARGMWEHLVMMLCEIAHAPRKIHRTNWRRYFTMHQNRQMMEYFLDPRPTIVVSGHFGNFEMAGFAAGLLGFPSYTIIRPLDNPYLNQYVNRFRSLHGQYILEKQGSSVEAEAVLERGGMLALLGDQHAGPRGCWVDFLGRPASCHKALAVFSLVSGAPLLVCYARRTGNPLQFEVGLVAATDPLVHPERCQSVRSLTMWYNAMLETVIRRDPEQYWWVHRRWKGEPPSRRLPVRAAA